MPPTAAFLPWTALAVSTSRGAAWLRRLAAAVGADDDEAFLSEAQDLADLERRLRRLERGPAPRFRPLDPFP